MFKQYRRTNIAEMREVKDNESYNSLVKDGVSISKEDALNHSPNPGDMIARNPRNHKDQWLVAKQYFKDNFELKD